MAGEGVITICGNATGPADLRFGPDGAARCSLTVAVNTRVKDGDRWTDGDPTFYRVTAWRQLGENVAQCVEAGTRLVVHGRLKARKYTTDAGVERLSLEVDADHVGADMRFATVRVAKAERSRSDSGSSSGGGGGWSSAPSPQSTPDDPWGTAPPAGQPDAADDQQPPF